ncbi:MAG: hypothetical protein GY805_27810, partial [Chloroflexi bacterium]|nr:hypothetical protein [Chloroflexota bacterium]
LWRQSYSLPNRELIPDWRGLLAEKEHEIADQRQPPAKRFVLAAVLGIVALILMLLWRRQSGAKH